ncbi:MAG: YjbH domain-containing protein, partial [Saprospiraceae bacterium]|nr:YjbH domain-containing protein [Saprospiraceae bacterium]
LQHQTKFYFYQLEALFHSEYSIKEGLVLTTDLGLNIVNNFDEYLWHVPDGELHHVRQNRRLYLTEGESGIRRMSLDYFFDINQNISAKASFGIIEWMYGGIGGEILYLPDNKRWGISLESYWLKQRDFNQRFTFQDYETVTAHLNYYYDLPFYNLRLKTSYGKFLGKDKGLLLDISRRYETGSRIGAMVALTDCDPGCVGEGSFNKWIYFTLPMDLFASSTARNKSSYVWSPLTKDAGQKLQTNQLYDIKMDAHDEMDTLRKKPWSIKKIFSGFSTTTVSKL